MANTKRVDTETSESKQPVNNPLVKNIDVEVIGPNDCIVGVDIMIKIGDDDPKISFSIIKGMTLEELMGEVSEVFSQIQFVTNERVAHA